jgi:peptidyl-prolyl cis-trans isomerase SurA
MRIISFLLIFLAFSALGQSDPLSEKTLFSVGQLSVTAGEFEYLFLKNHQNRPEEFSIQGIEEYFSLYQNFKLKVAEALSRGMDTTKIFRQEFEGYRKEIRKSFEEKRDDIEVLAREAFERQKKEIRASHILLLLKPDAKPEDTLRVYTQLIDLRKRFLKGESFETLARNYSEDPSGKVNGGDLSYFSAFDMVYPFEVAAFKLSKGEISMPVRTRFGYHLIHCTDQRLSEGEIEVSHILIRSIKENEESPREKIFNIYQRLQAGETWEVLCREYSEDGNTKNIGGRLKPFRRGAFGSSAPQFEDAAFGLKQSGDVSDPVETPYGWHLIRLERKIPPGNYEDVRQTLIKRVSRDERSQESVSKLFEAQKKMFGFKLNEKNYAVIRSISEAAFARGQWSYQFDPKAAQLELFSLNGKISTLEAFGQFASRTRLSSNENPVVLTELMLNKFIQEKLEEASEQKLLQENSAYRFLVQEYREGILLFSIMEQEVWNKASADTLGQKQFYLKHSDQYNAGERLMARIFASTDKSSVSDLQQKLEKGDSISAQDLKKFKSASVFRIYGKGEHVAIDRIPWVTGLHQTEVDKQHYLVEISRLIPPGPKSFDEARASVISDFQDVLERSWLILLKNKFPVKVNKKIKDQLIRKLQTQMPGADKLKK